MSTSSISVAMRTAISGLSVNQTALTTTSNNIANANTAGYTQKNVNLGSILLNGQGAGVQVTSISRNVDEFLLRDVRTQTSLLADVTVRSNYYASTQNMFGTPESDSSIGSRLTSLANRLQALAVEPASGAGQLSVVNDALTVTRQFNQMSQNIQDLRNQADDDISTAVTNVNTLLGNISDLNAQISRNVARNLPTGDMQDQRDQAVAQLAGYMDINSYTRPSGDMVIFSGSGRTLVDHGAATFSYTPVSAMGTNTTYPNGGIDGIKLDGKDVTSEFRSGQLKGLIDMRDTDLPNLNKELDQLATVLRDQINAIHNTGVSIPPPNTLTGTKTFSDPTVDTVSMTGTVHIAVLNADGTVASTPIDLNLDDLATVVGGTPTVAQIRDAINGAYAVPALPTDPVIPGLAGATASINADGALVITASDPTQGIGINEGTSAEATTGFGFSHFFGLNDFFVGTDVGGLASNITVRSDIAASPGLVARGALSDGTLVAGDSGVTTGDASIVSQMANKFTEGLNFAAAGGLSSSNTTLSSYGATIVADNATRAADVSDSKDFRSTVLADVQNKSDSISGVNMDEEMSNLILFQNSYAASARVITTLSEVLKTLTDMV